MGPPANPQGEPLPGRAPAIELECHDYFSLCRHSCLKKNCGKSFPAAVPRKFLSDWSIVRPTDVAPIIGSRPACRQEASMLLIVTVISERAAAARGDDRSLVCYLNDVLT